MALWDHDQYTLFLNERMEPNIDLFAKLPSECNTIVDLGSGSGDCSTILLRQKYPTAKIYAVDSSAELIAAAQQKKIVDAEWVTEQIENYEVPIETDLINLSSTLQWIQDHPHQIGRLFNALAQKGVLSIQMPNMFDKPFYQGILETANTGSWRQKLLGKLRIAPVLPIHEYQCILRNLTPHYKIWTVTYYLDLKGKNAILEWAKGAPLRPVASILEPKEYEEFCQNYNDYLNRHYLTHANGALLPFERLFLVAQKV